MFFYLSKILYYVIMPGFLIGSCLLLAIFLQKKRLKRLFLILGTSLFFLFSNNFIINAIFTHWEIPPTPFDAIEGHYDVGIVLTGITNMRIEPQDRVYFQKGADRILHAIELYKRGKIKKILITGGTGSLTHPDLLEADNLVRTLQLFGVPEEDMIIENQSRNTYENAKFTATILRERYPEGRFLLITSAFHLRRAKGCFDKQNIATDMFSTDFYTHPITFTPDSWLIPNENAFKKWAILEREIVGILMYKLAGYI